MQVLRPRRQHHLFLHHLCKHGAQAGCMFSVLKAAEEQVESHRKRKRPVFDKYAAAVASFVESYIAANQIYPKISEVVRRTGGNRSTIMRILNELNLEKKARGCKEVCVKGQDDMKIRQTIGSLSAGRPSNNISSKNSASPCSDKSEQLAQGFESAQVEASIDSMEAETDNESAQEVEKAQVEASIDSMEAETDNERIDISTQNLEKKGFSVPSDPALLTLLDQAMHSSIKADASRRVAPLMEVLQQKSSGSSRRVHLSAGGGIENDLSWDKTLWSIMPTSFGGEENTSGLKDEQPNVDRESMGHTSSSSSSEKHEESSKTASGLSYTIKVMSSKVKSILSSVSGKELLNVLKREADVFDDLKALKLFRRKGNTNAHAILQFKNKESMEKALKLKTITIVGENLSLQEGSAATADLTRGDYTQPGGLGESSVFQEVMQGMAGSLKNKDVSSTYSCAEYKKSKVCMQAQQVSHPRFSQTITIEDCPSNISLESIESFFSVFGKVQTSYGDWPPGKQIVVIEFENEGHKEKAMRVQQFTVDGTSFLIRSDSSCVAVRLKWEGSVVDLKEVGKACKKYGFVEKIFCKKSQIIEVTFGAQERHRMDELLKSLINDAYFKEKWYLMPAYEGYSGVDLVLTWHKDKIKSMVVLLKQLIKQLTEATREGTLLQFAADKKASQP